MAAKSKKYQLLIYGYIREFERHSHLNQIIPESIFLVIHLFYPRIEDFKWYKLKHGEAVTIVDDKTITTSRGDEYSKHAVCVSPNIISSDICEWYEWEFKVNNWTDYDSGVRFGFVAIPFEETIIDWNKGLGYEHKWDHYAIDICLTPAHFRVCGVFTRIYHIDEPKERTVAICEGDTLRVRIDFKDQDIKLYYNDEYVNCVYQNEIPKVVIPAASVCCADITVIHTDYE